jgi:pantothenate kinase-related protein Tda10
MQVFCPSSQEIMITIPVILLSRYQVLEEYRPMIVAVLGEKGGTGKTTLATNLTGMRASEVRGGMCC